MAVPGPGRDSGEWRSETGSVVTGVTGVAEEEEVFPVSSPEHLAHSLQALLLHGLRRHHRLVSQLAGGESVAVADPRELQSVNWTGLGQLREES